MADDNNGPWTRVYPQSALEPAGYGAVQLAELFWIMMIGAAVIWLLVIGIAIYAVRTKPRAYGMRGGQTLIIGGGVVFPVVVLAALLTEGLAMMPGLAPRGERAARGSGRRAVVVARALLATRRRHSDRERQ